VIDVINLILVLGIFVFAVAMFVVFAFRRFEGYR